MLTGEFRKLQTETLFPDWEITIGNVEMPVVILGGPAYPLLMKPNTCYLTTPKELFNYQLSGSRLTVEYVFGCLKGCWWWLLTRLDLGEKNIPMVIPSCCSLHNICSQGGKVSAGVEVEQLSDEFEQPDTRAIRAQHGAIQFRKALKDHFDSEPE